MPFSRCRQSIGRAFARPPHSAAVGSANAHALAKFATGDIMRTPSMARSCGSISSRARSPRAVKIRSIGPAFPAARSRCPRPRDRAAATGQRHVEKTHCCNMAFHCRTIWKRINLRRRSPLPLFPPPLAGKGRMGASLRRARRRLCRQPPRRRLHGPNQANRIAHRATAPRSSAS